MPHHSNLECFLSRTTPTVRSQFLPKRFSHDVNLHSQHLEYFNLADLWDCYDEWSAYGLGSPILLDNGETVVQYYTPSLSAMEVYTNRSFASRCLGDDYDGEYETDYSSSENECGMLSRSSSSSSDKTWELEDLGYDLRGCWPAKNRLGHLYCQYVEEEKPYWRTPLAEKINELAKKYPGLKSFKSVDLSPASWMAVAWYPIYVIPNLRNPKQVFASFLTYHTISSLFQDNIFGYTSEDVSCSEAGKGEVDCKGESNCISLPPFGLATYKMQLRVWINPETADCQRIASLLNGAESWLKQLQFHHHDYDYFRTRSM